MKALALVDERRVEVVERPTPRCGPADVVVAVRAVGLCGSDLSVYDGRICVPTRPWVLGHEGGGRVVEVGAGVSDRHLGQLVAIEPNFCCFHCAACRAGRTSACERRRILGINAPGIAAERVAVPAEFTWPVPEGTAPEALACLEPYVVTRTAARRAGVGAGSECLVIGAGSQGLLLCQRLLVLGAVPYVTDVHEGRMKLAERLGARLAVDGPSQFPFVFETSGAPAAFPGALSAVGRAGQLILIGQSSTPVQLATRDLVQRQLTITGSLIYDHPGDFAAAVTDLPGEEHRITGVMQARFRPSQAAEAFDTARSLSGKAWIDMSSW